MIAKKLICCATVFSIVLSSMPLMPLKTAADDAQAITQENTANNYEKVQDATSSVVVTSTDQFVFDGTVNKLTADITTDDIVTLSDPSDNLVVDLNGFTWHSMGIVLRIDNRATAYIYDSSEAKTGKIDSGSDAIDMSNGTLTLKDITVEGGDDGCDAIFATGGNITIEGCTLSAGKAGFDAANYSSDAGVSVVATIKDTTFALHDAPGDRNCAIELRCSSDEQKITLTGNNVFENNKIMMRSDYTKGVENGIVAGEGANLGFSENFAVEGRDNYTYCEITYIYTACGDEESPKDGNEYSGTCGGQSEASIDIQGLPDATYFYPAGYTNKILLVGAYGDRVSIGEWDLSGVSRIKITYGSDDTVQSIASDYIYVQDADGNVIGKARLSQIGVFWAQGQRPVEILIDSDYHGELFITKDDCENQIAIDTISFVASSIRWSLDNSGRLNIYGIGMMKYYSESSPAPWYSLRSLIKEVVLQNGVVSIGNYAFYGCTELSSITLADTVTSIGDGAFSGCTGLESIDLPNGINRVGKSTFENCTSLTSISIPANVESIGSYAFNGCTGLTSVAMSNKINNVGLSAFGACSSITRIDYRGSRFDWKQINIDSGNECLSEDVIVYSEAFGDVIMYSGTCGADLKWTLYDTGTLVISGQGDMYGYYSTYPWYDYRESVTSIIIQDGVTNIREYAFEGFINLKSVTIGEGVKEIGYSAFYDCDGIENVIIADIAKWCVISFASEFSNPLYNGAAIYIDGELTTELNIPDGVTSIGSYAFYNCYGLTSISMPDTVLYIGEYTFRNCEGLTSIRMSERLAGIGYLAFDNCSGLTSIDIPASVVSIGGLAFYGCDNISKVNICDISRWSIISFADECANPLSNHAYLYLNGEKVTDITINGGIDRIKAYAFYNCYGLTSVTIPEGVTSIGEYAFAECKNLTSVTMPKTLTDIGCDAFYYCTSLVSVTIPKGVRSISDCSFYHCSALESVTISEGVTSIGSYAFYYCTSLSAINIPSSVKDIYDAAFYGCQNIECVYITSIASWCEIDFAGIYSNPLLSSGRLYLNGELLTALVIPESVTTIKEYAFCYLHCIDSLIISNGVSRIGEQAFYGCYNLKTVYLPKSLSKIQYMAFDDCYVIEKVYYASNESDWESILFEEYNEYLLYAEIIYGVSDDIGGDSAEGECIAVGNDRDAEWALFADGTLVINRIRSASFDNIPFYKYRSIITTVKISDGVTQIPADAFYKCEALTSIVIPESVTYIGDSAFLRCSSLTDVLYGGTQEQWHDLVFVSDYNDTLLNAEFSYEYAPITVEDIIILAPAVKNEYFYGEEICFDGLRVAKLLSNGAFEEISDYTVSEFDKYSFGKQSILITYGEFDASFTVSVKGQETSVSDSHVKLGMTVGELKQAYGEQTVYVLAPDKTTVLFDDDIIRTGSVIQIMDGDVVVDGIAVVVSGDVDGDGKISAKDFIRLKKQIAQGSWVEYPEYADINRDGVVDTLDLEALALAIA